MKENNETLDSTEIKSAQLNSTCAGEALIARGMNKNYINQECACVRRRDRNFLMLKGLKAAAQKW